jgi:hypothetical protein
MLTNLIGLENDQEEEKLFLENFFDCLLVEVKNQDNLKQKKR